MPQKIFELYGDDWMKGMSLRTSSAIGGLFSSSSNFNPFEIAGMMQCSLAIATASNLSITTTPRVITGFQASGTAKLYVQSDTKLYEVLDGTPWTTTDKTAEITVTGGCRGAIIYKDKYVYSLNNQLRANALPVASGSDVQILGGYNSDSMYHSMCVGADKNLYVSDYSGVAKITSVTGTAGNSTDAFNLESGMIVRDLVNDGRYLVLIADNNQSSLGSTPSVPVSGKFRCQVAFWDMAKGTADQLYEFTDSYLIGAKILDGAIYVFGGDNLYVCNISTPPKAIFSFKSGSTITEKPQTAFQITQAQNSIYWCGQTNGNIFAYGSLFPGMKKVFYQPFSAAYTPSAIMTNSSNFYIGTNGTDNFLQVTDTGSTRNTGSVITAPIILPNPYQFDFIKVVMREPLVSGDNINAYMTNHQKTITDSNSKSFAQIGAKQTVLFDRKALGSTADVEYFEDFQLIITSNRAVARVEVWGTPIPQYSQVI